MIVETIQKVPTGITGFDLIAQGGLPRGRATLVSGSSASGKTVFALQFLAEGIRQFGESGVYVTFEESPADIRRNVLGLGWDLAEWERQGRFAFVDASPVAEDEPVISGTYDMGVMMARIRHAVQSVGATRLAMDGLANVLARGIDEGTLRRELFRIVHALKELDVTAILTAERVDDFSAVSRYGIEEFVVDNTVILRNVLAEEKRRRTMEILKFRGAHHQKGEFPFTILSGRGIAAIPLSSMQLQQRSSEARITSGIAELDAMCGGGFFRDSIILVSGATGTGKTLTATHFLGGSSPGDRCLLFAFEESRDQLFRNAAGWGFDFEALEAEGRLRVVADYPEVMSLEDHLIRMKTEIEDFRPTRLAVDSLSALERVSTLKGFREFVIAITSFVKDMEITGLFTSTTPALLGGTSVTEAHISTITDSIVLLRYVELFGEMRRGITVLKMRGSYHDRRIREYEIDGSGMHLGLPFRGVSGILSGTVTASGPQELDRMEELFGGSAEPA